MIDHSIFSQIYNPNIDGLEKVEVLGLRIMNIDINIQTFATAEEMMEALTRIEAQLQSVALGWLDNNRWLGHSLFDVNVNGEWLQIDNVTIQYTLADGRLATQTAIVAERRKELQIEQKIVGDRHEVTRLLGWCQISQLLRYLQWNRVAVEPLAEVEYNMGPKRPPILYTTIMNHRQEPVQVPVYGLRVMDAVVSLKPGYRWDVLGFIFELRYRGKQWLAWYGRRPVQPMEVQVESTKGLGLVWRVADNLTVEQFDPPKAYHMTIQGRKVLSSYVDAHGKWDRLTRPLRDIYKPLQHTLFHY